MVMPSISTNGSPSITMRSAKVPESPSSALQTMYFWSAGASRQVFHLMPVGKAAPPRPRRPESVTACTMAAGAQRERRFQSAVAAVRAVVVEAARIDDADAGERESLLALQVGDVVR